MSEAVMAMFLESGGYDRSLRQMRARFEQQVRSVSHAVSKYFPEGTRVSRPDGGYVLWIELPRGTASVCPNDFAGRDPVKNASSVSTCAKTSNRSSNGFHQPVVMQ